MDCLNRPEEVGSIKMDTKYQMFVYFKKNFINFLNHLNLLF
jgi:hypothetical protein